MAKTLSVSTVKTHLPSLLTGVEEREEEVVITRNGAPAAVLVNYEEYARLKATVDVLGDDDLMRQVRQSRGFFGEQHEKGLSFEQVFDEPLRPVRKRARRG